MLSLIMLHIASKIFIFVCKSVMEIILSCSYIILVCVINFLVYLMVIVFRGIFLNYQTKVIANTVCNRELSVEVPYGNPWPICQTKCSPIYVLCQIVKFNVCQMYHYYIVPFCVL